MNDKSITIKMNELLKLLDMPEKNRIVSQLSDGQRRRVSLCVALIHSPMLVILDEPTVGVDPVLRHEIWQYLDMICKSNSVTVIITTHYIEEARNASTVAYLRDGRILVETRPEILMNVYNCIKLEDVFLALCENSGPVVSNEILIEEINEENVIENLSLNKRQLVTVEHFCALFHKNMRHVYRSHRFINFYAIINPAISILILYMLIMKHVTQYTLSYHNNDASNLSTQYISLLNEQIFRKNIEYSDQSVINSVIDGKSNVGILIPRNFSQNLRNVLIDNDFTTAINISMYLELTKITNMNIMPELGKTYMNLIENYLSSNGLNPIAAHPPFEQINIYGNSQLNVYDFAIPSITALALLATPFAMCLLSIVTDKVERVFERTIIAGVDSFSYYFAHLITKALILVPQVMIFLIIIYPILVSSTSNLIVIYLFLYTQGLIGITLGILFSSFISDYSIAAGVSILLSLILLCIGGVVWPLEALPQTIQYVNTYVLPVTLPIKSMQCLLLRGCSIAHYDVCIAFVSNIILTIVYFSIAVIYSHFSVFQN